jgi:CubicO group peptidase (beta-lactamase class C family)
VPNIVIVSRILSLIGSIIINYIKGNLMKKIILVLAMLGILQSIRCQNLNTSDYTQLIKKYRSIIQEQMKSRNFAGVGVALVSKDSILWQEGFGYSDKEKGIPFTINTDICIGSLTKTFTALAIMQLNEKEKIDIEKPLVKYLPEFAIKMREGNINQITTKSVMLFHSGIQTDIDMNLTTDEPLSKILGYLKDTYTAYPPNLISCYSNVGYSVLGLTIEKVSGDTYTSYLKKNIFQPIGMLQTGFKPDKNLINISKAYNNKGESVELFPMRDIPAGGIYSNIHDLSLFMQELLRIKNGRKGYIIEKRTLDKIWSVQNEDIPLDDAKRGLPWLLYTKNSDKIAWCGGSIKTHNSGMALATEHDLAVIFLVNTDGGFGLANNAVSMLMEAFNFIDRDVMFNKFFYQPDKPQNIIDLTADKLYKHAGDYTQIHSAFSISISKNSLILNTDNEKIILKPTSENEFQGFKMINDTLKSTPEWGYYFFRDIRGHHILFHNWQIVGDKTTIPELNSTWLNRIGKYKILNYVDGGYDSFSEVELYIKDGKWLMFKLLSNPPYIYPLLVLSDSETIICGLGDYGGSTVEYKKENESEFLIYSGMKMKKIK